MSLCAKFNRKSRVGLLQLFFSVCIWQFIHKYQFEGTHAKVNSSFFESKIFHGKPAREEEYTFVVSLQLDEVHICSSGFFQKGYLLTLRRCASYMLNGINIKMETGTAVYGNSDLKKGQTALILDISFPIHGGYSAEGVEVVTLADTIDYTNIEIPVLYTKPINIRLMGSSAAICGWGGVVDDQSHDKVENCSEDQLYSDDLRCMSVIIYSTVRCSIAINNGDFKRKLLCGVTYRPGQMTTLGDLGSPLIKTIADENNNTDKNNDKKYILGITLPRVESNGTFLRFLKITHALPYIQKVMDNLKLSGAIAKFRTSNISRNSSSSRENTFNKPSKRPRLQESLSEETE